MKLEHRQKAPAQSGASGSNRAAAPSSTPTGDQAAQQGSASTSSTTTIAAAPLQTNSTSVAPSQGAASKAVTSECVSATWNEASKTLVCPTSPTGQLTGQLTSSASATGSIAIKSSTSKIAGTLIPTASAGSSSASEGLTGGAVAGVAIGMLLAGFLIAGAAFLFLSRRQKRRRYNPTIAPPPPHAPNSGAGGRLEKDPAVVTSAHATDIDDMLPQPASDDTITDAALKIRDNIKNHVREFYHVSPVPAASINQANMKELAIATGTSSSVLASMLLNISTRAETLRLIVAWSVLSRCTGERVESLLPGELAPLASAVPGRNGKNAAQSAMYSKWKAMTGALLHGRVGQDTQDRFHRFASAAADLDAIVAPFVQSGLESQRSKNLNMILARSANFAFLLFEQPGVFHFGFSSEHGGLTVFPALVQIIGDQGQVLVPSRVLLEKEIAA